MAKYGAPAVDVMTTSSSTPSLELQIAGLLESTEPGNTSVGAEVMSTGSGGLRRHWAREKYGREDRCQTNGTTKTDNVTAHFNSLRAFASWRKLCLDNVTCDP